MQGDLLLTHNKNPLVARNKSSAPRRLKNHRIVADIPNMGFAGKVKATMWAIKFIWGADQSLKHKIDLQVAGSEV